MSFPNDSSVTNSIAAPADPIHMLSSEVVDQIAAGEVVDRPAHLVKELVENAIDAGARAIEIEFDQGGRCVRVTDDGRGISEKDLKLALARHATSKIAKADDLWNLHSFGFRGEALASIAAVSRLSLQSRERGSETAFRIVSEFGKISGVEPIGGNPGTTVFVEELFGSVPARLKFLKSETAEISQIRTTLRAVALANEGVEFRLRTKGKLESLWPRAESFLERTKQVLDLQKLYQNHSSYNGTSAQIVFASPHDVTGNARSIITFVQKRWVQDRGLQAAVIDAYRGLLMHGEFPIAVVRVESPPGEVDVNIHPTKSAVKFRDQQTAFRAVNRTLREALEQAPWLVTDASPAVTPVASETPTKKMSVSDLTRPYQPSSDAVSQTGPGEAPNLSTAPLFSTGRFEAPEFNSVLFRQKQDETAGAGVRAAVESYVGQAELSRVRFQESLIQSKGDEAGPIAQAVNPAPVAGPWSRLQVLGQANLTYIIAQDKERIVLVDQHAAHERVAYERLMRAWQGGSVSVQTLLIPISVDLESDGAEALMNVASELEKLGVSIDQMGPQTIAVRAKPALISEAALTKSLTTLAREISEKGGSFALEKKISDLCATMACHSVVRAGQALSIEQMKSLLVQMDEFTLSSFCPHGRPVSVDYPFTKLERDFGRLV